MLVFKTYDIGTRQSYPMKDEFEKVHKQNS